MFLSQAALSTPRRISIGLAAAALLGFGWAAAGESGLHIVSKIAGPDGGWDYATFDAGRKRLFLAHETGVMIVDSATGKLTPGFAPGSELHQVFAIPGANVLVTTNAGDDTLRFFDATDGKLQNSVTVAKNPDAAIYEPKSNSVLVMGGDNGIVSVVSVESRKLVGKVKVGGNLEFPQLDGLGKLYINNRKFRAIDVVDLSHLKVVSRITLKGCASPSGLAYVSDHRLIAACGNGRAKIVDAETGVELASLRIGSIPDAVLYDASRQLAMIPAASGGLYVIALAGSENNKLIDTVDIPPGTRTGAIDPTTGRVYLPAADFSPPTAPGRWPTEKPGTFKILVLDR
jgi:DNA-binding beta-propeller fold protein YncE